VFRGLALGRPPHHGFVVISRNVTMD
jgi:hypothetical protein